MYRAIRAFSSAVRFRGCETLVDLLPQLAVERPLWIYRLQGECCFWLSIKCWSLSAVVSFDICSVYAFSLCCILLKSGKEATRAIIWKMMKTFIFYRSLDGLVAGCLMVCCCKLMKIWFSDPAYIPCSKLKIHSGATKSNFRPH